MFPLFAAVLAIDPTMFIGWIGFQVGNTYYAMYFQCEFASSRPNAHHRLPECGSPNCDVRAELEVLRC